MKKILTFLICSMGALVSVQAQQGRPGQPIGGIVVKGGKNPGGSLLLNLGGGIANPNSESQSQNFLGNGFNVNGGLYIPMLSLDKGRLVGAGQTPHFFTIGPNISGAFSKYKQTADGFPTYKVTGQTGDTKPVPALDGNPILFTIETGLHANFSFGKVTISPVLNGAYFNFTQDAFNVKQTNQVNGKEYTFDLYSQQKTQKSGFAFIPKLRVGYFPGSLGFYLESNYTLGPGISVEQSRLKPLGTGNDKDGSYQLDQLMAGKQVTSERHTPFHNLAVNFGVTYSFRRAAKKAARKAAKQAKAKSDMSSIGANTNPYFQDSNLAGNMDKVATGDNPLHEGSSGVGVNPLFKQDLVYSQNYPVKDAAVLAYLNTDQLIIEQGTYKPDFSANSYGDITLKLAEPISAKGINKAGIKRMITATENGKAINKPGLKRTIAEPVNKKEIQESGIKRTIAEPENGKGINQAGIKRQSFSGFRCDTDCKEEGTYCFTCKIGSTTALFYQFEIIPVVENDLITAITLSNTSISQNGTALISAWFSKKGYDYYKASSDMAAVKTVNPLYEGSGNSGQNPMSEPQNQSIVNTTKSNTKDRTAVLNNEMMQVAYTGHDPILKSTKLSILGNGKTLPNGTPIVAGREVKGIIKGSVIISSGNSRVANTITIKQPETGDEGNFTVKLGSDTLHRIYINDKEFGKIKLESEGGIDQPQNQSIINTTKSNTKDRVSLGGTDGISAATTPISAAPQSPLYQAQNTEHMSPLYKGNSLARPGEPIGGIVVKGGRHPGGEMKLTTNSNGEFSFTNPKTADFQFMIETPETSTANGNNARPGGPIGGIIVKGGKNPGGQMRTLTSDANGVVTLKDLPAGNYKFRITAPAKVNNSLYEPQNTEHMSPLYKGK